MEFLKKNRGITLIALIITIIILLILAGVSIATLTGENGILTKANKAKEDTEKASEDEQRELAVIEANMNDTETIFQGIKIPAGFAPTRIEGESTVDEGLVIVDGEGNSYVWIEVPKSIYDDEQYTTNGATKPSTSTDYDNIEKVLQNYAKDYRKEGHSDTFYDGCGINSDAEYKNLKNKMLKSVYENGGFWVGQYEMGTDEIRTEESKDKLTKAVCKEGAYPYNLVTCSQAQELASNMNSGNSTSSLMFGIQWDLVLKVIEIKGNLQKNQLLESSKDWGNYRSATFDISKGSYMEYSNQDKIIDSPVWKKVNGIYRKNNSGVLLTTGVTQRNNILNIFDFAGNVNEYTLENCINSPSGSHTIVRGGWSYDWSNCANTRDGYGKGFYNVKTGFRCTIF